MCSYRWVRYKHLLLSDEPPSLRSVLQKSMSCRNTGTRHLQKWLSVSCLQAFLLSLPWITVYDVVHPTPVQIRTLTSSTETLTSAWLVYFGPKLSEIYLDPWPHWGSRWTRLPSVFYKVFHLRSDACFIIETFQCSLLILYFWRTAQSMGRFPKMSALTSRISRDATWIYLNPPTPSHSSWPFLLHSGKWECSWDVGNKGPGMLRHL